MILSILPIRKPQQGFTLLELLMVVTILSAVAWMTIGVVDNNSDQIRYEDTRNRLETIKRAIIGDTSRTINGQPEIRGYVADMGNLPPTLQALIQPEYCEDDPIITSASGCSGTWYEPPEYCTDHSSATVSACITGGYEWVGEYCTNYTSTSQSACESLGHAWRENYYVYDKTYALWTGWNGPYLQARELQDYAKFRDGWGNLATSTTNANDFGWDMTVSADLTIQSLGSDGVAGGSETYEKDYPEYSAGYSNFIDQNDYTITVTSEGTVATGDGVGGITVDFGTPEPCWGCWDDTNDVYVGFFSRSTCEDESDPTHADYYWRPKLGVYDEGLCIGDIDGVSPWIEVDGAWLQSTSVPEDICLTMTYRDNGELKTHSSVHNTLGTVPNASAQSTFTWDGSRQQLTFVFEDGTTLPMGLLSYNIFEYDTTATPPACTTTEFQKENTKWTIFNVVPKMSTAPFTWKLQ